MTGTTYKKQREHPRKFPLPVPVSRYIVGGLLAWRHARRRTNWRQEIAAIVTHTSVRRLMAITVRSS